MDSFIILIILISILAFDPDPPLINQVLKIILTDYDAESHYFAMLGRFTFTVYGTYWSIDPIVRNWIYFKSFEDNEDGTLVSIDIPYIIVDRSIFIKKYKSPGISVYYFHGNDFAYKEPDSMLILGGDININIPSGELFSGCTDECTAHYDFVIIAPITGEVTLSIEWTGKSSLYLNGEYIISVSGSSTDIDTHTKYLEEGEGYNGYLIYSKYSDTDSVELSFFWEYAGQPKQLVPASSLLHASPAGINQNMTVGWETGTVKSSDYSWEPIWGDGLKLGTENWDDGKDSIEPDGWSSNCVIDDGFACDGGSITGKDICVKWVDEGKAVASGSRSCESVWGDGMKSSEEEWDDGNEDSNTDGCTQSCTIDDGYACSGGSFSGPDICTLCSTVAGVVSEDKRSWEPIWGDGLRHELEEWDDNNLDSDDGCSNTCIIEEGYEWSGGSVNGRDTCTLCSLTNQSPSDDKRACETKWGDGLKHSSEECEDANAISGDGCNSTCRIEADSFWRTRISDSIDECTNCAESGQSLRDDIDWEIKCGDGRKHTSEQCEDGGTTTGDGCDDNWIIEDNYICHGGSFTSVDTWEICEVNYEPNTDKDQWIPIWGDGLKMEEEQCEDDNTDSGDGWSSSWVIEDNFICTGGSETDPDTCTQCVNNTEPNNDKTQWIDIPVNSTNNNDTEDNSTNDNTEDYSKSEAALYSGATSAVVWVIIVVNLVSSVKIAGSVQGIMVVQLIVIFLYIGVSLPPLIGKTTNNMEPFMGSFFFIIVPFESDLDSSVGYLRNLEESFEITDSSSAFVNLLPLIFVSLIIFPIINLMVFLIHKCFEKRKDSWLKRLIDKLNSWFIFNFYIRFFMIVYMFIMFSVFKELHLWLDGESGKLISRLFCLALFTICTGVILLVGFYWFKFAHINEKKSTIKESNLREKFSTLFSGIKTTRIHRLHSLIFFVKRYLICAVIFLLKDIGVDLKLIILLTIQLCSLLWSIGLRSYQGIKDQIIEIICESLFTVLLMWVLFQEEVSDWTKTSTYCFIFLIIGGFVAQLIVTIGNFLIIPIFLIIFSGSTCVSFLKEEAKRHERWKDREKYWTNRG